MSDDNSFTGSSASFDDVREMLRRGEPARASMRGTLCGPRGGDCTCDGEHICSFADVLEPGAFRAAFGEWVRVSPGKCVLCLAGDARPGSGVCAVCAARSE